MRRRADERVELVDVLARFEDIKVQQPHRHAHARSDS
jgi:hypothetical protein